MKSSMHEDQCFFGPRISTADYLHKVEAAKAFGRIRGVVDQQQNELLTLNRRKAMQRKGFMDRMKKAINDLIEGNHVLLLNANTIDPSLSPEGVINGLILGVVALGESDIKTIKTHKLEHIISRFCFQPIDEVRIPEDTKQEFIGLFEKACEGNTTATALALSKLLQAGQAQGSPPSKRLRPNPPEAPSIPLDRVDTSGPFAFHGDDLLSLPITDVQPNLDTKNVFQFMEARGDRLPMVMTPILEAVRAGRQWGWERRQAALSPNANETRTNSIVAMLPDNHIQDISLIFRVGNKAGRRIINYLDFRDSTEQVVNDPPA
ncbi:hypothetical protein BHE90_016421 [Fusarium euwallaceae]|uniref:Uncharacterized protein n=2 Tax=Fusarium solani species complex TaxID=232080 RepID=A0A428RUM8_9HYPO|nr:hypothetical protein CEP52_017275 [Fusarium oligoseptatum]RTE69198.1 hypothetical protein BHE90_016421 [Fusarium euwallaceae]